MLLEKLLGKKAAKSHRLAKPLDKKPAVSQTRLKEENDEDEEDVVKGRPGKESVDTNSVQVADSSTQPKSRKRMATSYLDQMLAKKQKKKTT